MISHFFADSNASRGERVVRGLFALGLCGFLLVVVWEEGSKQWRVRRWPEVACRVVDSRVEVVRDAAHQDRPYVFRVAFAFEWEGRSYTGDQFHGILAAYGSAAEADAVAAAHPVGSTSRCRVNPADPTQSALVAGEGGDLIPLAIMGGFCVLVIGFYGIPQTLGRRFPFREAGTTNRAGRGGVLGSRRDRILCATICVGLFAATGFWGVGPLVRNARTWGWTATPCRVESSAVAVNEIHGEGYVSLYRVDIL